MFSCRGRIGSSSLSYVNMGVCVEDGNEVMLELMVMKEWRVEGR